MIALHAAVLASTMIINHPIQPISQVHQQSPVLLQCDSSSISTMQPDGTYTPYAKGQLHRGRISVEVGELDITFIMRKDTGEERLNFEKDYNVYRNDSGQLTYNKRTGVFTLRTGVQDFITPGVMTPVSVEYHCE